MRAVGAMEGVPREVRTAVVPARVPGCVHTDLMRAGLIEDPRVGFNEWEIQWVGETDWEYRGVFRVEAEMLGHERLDLVCEGLDTIAEVSVNGRVVGAAANMFHPHRFDLRGVLSQPGADNEIVIVFRSPLRYIRAERERLGALPHNGDGLGWEPYPYIRKTACNFGWDWAPRVATCGVGRGIRVEGWNTARIASLRPHAHREGQKQEWTLDVAVDVEWAQSQGSDDAVRLLVELAGPGLMERASLSVWGGARTSLLTLGPVTAETWWPAGCGTQPLYSLRVQAHRDDSQSHEERRKRRLKEALSRAGTPIFASPSPATNVTQLLLDRAETQIAFREVRLNTDPDEHGRGFQFEVNGKPVFCKGANWIPEGVFPEDRSPERIRERVRQAAAANMNMLRVWGGGAYECDAFYEECDRLGIMVWQDFMFACACFPEHPEFSASVEREARHQIARLSSHPCVVLWCGGNECVWGRESWGHAASDTAGPWKERTKDRAWGAGYWFGLLPRLVRELDPTRPYWANSPWCGGEDPRIRRASSSACVAPNATDQGNRHTWDASPGSGAFRGIVPRFCSEFGHQAPANEETLAKAIEAAELRPDSEGMRHRQRGTGGMEANIEPQLRAWLASNPGTKAATFSEWVMSSQRAQADALAAGIGWLSENRPRCMGALVWQFNDAWPGMSWSLIDSEGRPKAAYFAVKKAFAQIET